MGENVRGEQPGQAVKVAAKSTLPSETTEACLRWGHAPEGIYLQYYQEEKKWDNLWGHRMASEREKKIALP